MSNSMSVVMIFIIVTFIILIHVGAGGQRCQAGVNRCLWMTRTFSTTTTHPELHLLAACRLPPLVRRTSHGAGAPCSGCKISHKGRLSWRRSRSCMCVRQGQSGKRRTRPGLA